MLSVLTLRREIDGATEGIADLYELDYHNNLTRRWQERGLFAKWALPAATILVALVPMLFVAVKKLIPRGLTDTARPRVCFGKEGNRRCLVKKKLAFWGGAIRWRDLGQILILLWVFGLLVGYLVVLTIAAVQTFSSGFPPEEMLTEAQAITIAATALGIVLPQGLRQQVLASAVDTTTLVQYLAFGARRRARRTPSPARQWKVGQGQECPCD